MQNKQSIKPATAATRVVALAAAALLGLGISSANATTFTFSETFDTGGTVTGSFTGTANGDLITGLSNISVVLNGVAFNGNGSLYGSYYDTSTGNFVSGGAVASFDGAQNNFLFIDSDYPNNGNYSNFFYSIPGYSDSAYSGLNNFSETNNTTTSYFTAVATDVPEPASLAVVGMGLMGALAARRRRKG